MKDILTVAAYIYNRYKRDYGKRIDEMKLHKLIYFTQRECLIQTNKPMFPEGLEAWRFGPVAPMVRDPYRKDTFDKDISEAEMADYMKVLNYVFKHYAHKDPWSLSRLSQGEICWKNARKGFQISDSSEVPIPLEDIRKDANRIRERRRMLKEEGLLQED